MSGLKKPATHRVASRRTRHPAINTNRGGGILCGSNNSSLFISSYDEDKKFKYRQQMKDRIKKLTLVGIVGIVVLFAMSKRGGSPMDADEAAAVLSHENMMSAAESTTSEATNLRPPPVPAPAVPVPPAPAETVILYDRTPQVDTPLTALPSSNPLVIDPLAPMSPLVMKGANDIVCGTELPFDLADRLKWPTTYTPSVDQNTPLSNTEVVLLKNDTPFGGLGTQLNAFFHAYDFAYEEKRPLVITKDSWALKMLLPLFFDPLKSGAGASLDATIQEVLGVKIVENEAALLGMNVKVPDATPANMLFYWVTRALDKTQIMNRRDTILRKLFQYPSQSGPLSVCDNINNLLVWGTQGAMYTVVHIATPGTKKYLDKLNGSTGKDFTAACEMQPEYVKNILKVNGMENQAIFPIDTDQNSIDNEAHARLQLDPQLASHLKYITDAKKKANLAANMYLAVLADCYIGNPVDQLSMWIARMRFALGIENTHILTEKRPNGDWVQYSQDTHSLLYDRDHLGIPWMG